MQAVAKWQKLAEEGRWDDFVAAMLQEHYDTVYTRAQLKYLTPGSTNQQESQQGKGAVDSSQQESDESDQATAQHQNGNALEGLKGSQQRTGAISSSQQESDQSDLSAGAQQQNGTDPASPAKGQQSIGYKGVNGSQQMAQHQAKSQQSTGNAVLNGSQQTAQSGAVETQTENQQSSSDQVLNGSQQSTEGASDSGDETVQAAGALSHLFGGPRSKLMQQMGTKQLESTLRWHKETVEDISDENYTALAIKILQEHDPAALAKSQGQGRMLR